MKIKLRFVIINKKINKYFTETKNKQLKLKFK